MKTSGQVAVWRYRQAVSGYRGFHTTADAAGALTIARAIAELAVGLERTVDLAPITPAILAVPNDQRDKAVGYARFVIRAVPGAGIQRFSHAHPVVTLEASKDTLAELAFAYQGLTTQEGDFTIGPDEHNLWFWWWPQRG
jgi:hypothetical protein